MTQEEKARAYDEVIEKLRDFYRDYDTVSCLIDVKEELANLFPELKGSEDERIRGKIIATIHLYYGEPLEDEAKEMIAWLEKQGEQKPVFEIKAPEESLGIDSDTYNKIVDECIYGEQKPIDADLKDIVDKEANAIWKEINTGSSYSIIDSFNQFYGICWQVAGAVVDCKKPTEWIQELESKLSNATPEQLAEWKEKYFKVEPAWSEEDKKMSRFIGNAITADGASEYLESKGIQVIDAHVWLDELKDKVQPRQEWSEDDKNFMCDTLSNLTELKDRYGEGYGNVGKCIGWLESIKDRVQPQPKQAWSEKDEVALDDALWCCKQAASIAKDENDMGNVWYAENWLKSIKDKYTSL